MSGTFRGFPAYASARLMREAMAEAGDTKAVLSHFVAQMDGEQSRVLRAVLEKLTGRRPA